MRDTPRTERIKALLTAALSPTTLRVQDNSADHVGHLGAQSGAGHFTVEIASPHFEGKTRVEKHQHVYAALADMMPDEIHALVIRIL